MTPVQDRDLNHLHQLFRSRVEPWLTDVRAEFGPNCLLVVETARTPERQAYLYAQGRTRPGNIVTYTLDSCHRYKTALDWVPLVGGAPSWDAARYQQIYDAVPPSRYGLELLSFERPHIQLAGGQAGARALGIVRDRIYTSRWPVNTPPIKPPADAGKVVRLFDPATNTQTGTGTLIGDKVYTRPK